jgi:formylglycine-generating enzyme required for sulfatase activity
MLALRRSHRLAGLVALGLLAVSALARADECPPGMILVPGGPFEMGDLEGFPDEKPLRPMTVKSFCLDATEVTVAAYAACAREGLCTPAHSRPEWSTLKSIEMTAWSGFCNADRADRANHPVNCVVWDQGERFCSARGLRLPTEAEWEYAARGGNEERKFPWGKEPPAGDLTNMCGSECEPAIAKIRGAWGPLYPQNDGWVATAPVGSFPKGDARWGHHDMSGNVCEWVSGSYCPYDHPDCGDAASPMCRGNHFLANNLKKARPGRRNRDDARHRGPDVGFRCAVDLEITARRAPLTDHVTTLPELPSFVRVAILGAIALLVGAAIAGFGGAAAALVLGSLIYVAELDPKTSTATALVAIAAAYLGALAAPALRRRVTRPLVAPTLGKAFGAALVAGALIGFLPDRLQLGAIALSLAALAARVIWKLRGPAPGAAATATAVPTLLAAALGGSIGHVLHARPDPGLSLVMGSAALVGALIRGLAPPRERSRAGQVVLALALLALGLIVFAREILPATVFPNL